MGDFNPNNPDPRYNSTLIQPGGIPLASGSLKGLRFPTDENDRLWTPGVVLIAPAYNHQIQDAYAIDTSMGLPQALCVQEGMRNFAPLLGSSNMIKIGSICDRGVGPANTAFTWGPVDTRDLKTSLDIHALASGAGTATLDVLVSNDGTNYLTLDSFVAAATNVVHYDPTTPATTIALYPLAFKYLKVTAGAAGAGSTVTITVGIK